MNNIEYPINSLYHPQISHKKGGHFQRQLWDDPPGNPIWWPCYEEATNMLFVNPIPSGYLT